MIDKVLCLSLERRLDRRLSLEANYPKCLPKIEYFNALTPENSLPPPSWHHAPSYWCTSEGHRRILEKLWCEEDWTTCLILEDDALFLPEADGIQDWMQYLNSKRPDWLVAFFGPHYQRPPTKVDDNILLNNGSTMSHAYCVNRHGVWRLYDHLYCDSGNVVDWAYDNMMQQDKCSFSPTKSFVTTRSGYSDNGLGWKPQGT